MADGLDFSVGQRVRILGSGEEYRGTVVDDFGAQPDTPVLVGSTQIAGASRRWAVQLDDGALKFVNSCHLAALAADS